MLDIVDTKKWWNSFCKLHIRERNIWEIVRKIQPTPSQKVENWTHFLV